MDFLTPFALGGLWLAYFLWQLDRIRRSSPTTPTGERPLSPPHADLEEAEHEKEIDHELK